MTVDDALVGSSAWLQANALAVLMAAVLFPLVGTTAAFIGKGGKTDTDGKLIASTVMALAMTFFALDVLFVCYGVFIAHASLLDTNLFLLTAPVLCLVLSVVGLRTVFPLGQLGSTRVIRDVGFFCLVVGMVAWFLSKFHGWSIVFLGSFGQLLVAGLVVLVMLWWLWGRMFRDEKTTT
jgi:hypothetical protein